MPSTAACVTCGKRVFVDDRFCAGCGTPVNIQDAGSGPGTDKAVTGSTICPTCAAPLMPGNEFCSKCGTRTPDAPTLQSDVSVRRVIADSLAKATTGDFEIVRELGRGAMGAVYLARDLALGRKVAIKLIAPAFLDNPTMVERFMLEAQTVASLRHPNIVNIHSVQQFADLHYFVMDYIDGPSLRRVLRDHGPLEIPVVQALLFQIGSGLSYAHRRGRGVIHRDVKPANIMLDREGNAFITDFGISKIAQSKSGLTVTGTTVGTPDYMSPEQCRDEVLTGASDQYALGIVAYEMLCGAPPFTGSHHAVMFAHTSDEPSPVTELRADCPSEVAEAVMRMLAKSPEDRWPDVGHAVEALGGRPLVHSDPVRNSILGLMETGLAVTVGLDTGSPLSPVPGAGSVDEMIPASVSISGLPAWVEPGDSFTLRADARGAAGAEIPELDALWATSDPAIAIVDGGAVQAIAAGPVSITATVGSVANTVILTVAEPSVAKIAVIPSTVRTEPGARIPLKADIEDRRGNRLERDVRWASDADAIVTVSEEGEAEAQAPGSATVTAEVDGILGNASITVEEAEVRAIQLSQMPTSVVVGDEFSVVASLTDARGVALDREVTWESSDAEIASVEGGVVAAVAVGTVTITASFEEQSAAVDVTILPRPVASIEISGVPESPRVGDEFSVVASLTDAKGVALDGEVTWESSDAEIATVEGGVVTAVAVGTVTITASCDEQSAAVDVTVLPQPVASIEISGLPESPRVGDEFSVVASLHDARGVALDREVTWESSDAEIASVEGGVVAAVAVGTVTITASFEEQSAAVDVTILPRPVASIEISGVPESPRVGDEFSVVASLIDARGVAVDREVTWESSDSEIATVEDGVVKAGAVGTATITASCEGRSAVADVTVLPQPVASIEISGLPKSTKAGDHFQLDAAPLDGEGRSLPSKVEWHSSDKSVASVSRSGIVHARKAGEIEIVASADDVDQTVQLVVKGAAVPAEPARPSARPRRAGRIAAFAVPVIIIVAAVVWLRPGFLARTTDSVVTAAVSVEPSDAIIVSGDSVRLVAAALDASGARIADRATSWSSDDTLVATVDAEGVVVARAAGITNVAAVIDGFEALTTITVPPEPETITETVAEGPDPSSRPGQDQTAVGEPVVDTPPAPPPPPRVASVSVTALNTTMLEGTGQAVALRIFDPRGERLPARNHAVSWRSTDASVVSVSARGDTLTARAPGRAYVVAIVDGVADSVLVNVDARVASVSIGLSSTSMREGTIQALAIRILDARGRTLPAPEHPASWRSTDPAVVSVGIRGDSLAARGPGSAYVVATVDGARDSVLVSVEASVAAVEIQRGDFTLIEGSSTVLQAVVLGSSRQRLGNRDVRWVSSDPRVASVDTRTGRVTGNLPGTARLVAQSEGVEGRVTVAVESAAAEPPTTAEVQAEVDRYLSLLVAGDRDGVQALFGNTAEDEQHRQLLDLLGQRNFSAELVGVGEVSVSADRAAVRFDVQLSWRSFTGSNRQRPAAFQASLEHDGQGWRMTSCTMVGQGEP